MLGHQMLHSYLILHCLIYHYPIYLHTPPETFIAEKLQAIVSLGMANSRMKDYYDLWVICQNFKFDGSVLSKAIKTTFVHIYVHTFGIVCDSMSFFGYVRFTRE